MNYYLKVYRNLEWAYINIQHWIDAISYTKNPCVYIVCDDNEFQKEIEKKIATRNIHVEYIESNRSDEDLKYIVENVCTESWRNAAYAHLTTFLHAKENSVDYFWNIDADDTYVCLDEIRVAEMLNIVEEYSYKNETSIISLDMWRSYSFHTNWSVKHWSFGVTFTNNSIDWINIAKKHCTNELLRKKITLVNLDWYFSFLKECMGYNYETFYLENLRFIHYAEDMFHFPSKSGVSMWKEGRLTRSIVKYIFGSDNLGEFPIASDVIRFDMNITDEEGYMALLHRSGEDGVYYKDKRQFTYGIVELMKKRNQIYLNNKNANMIVFWGAGKEFRSNYSLIKNFYNVKYVCDKDPDKWGKEIEKDVFCISPQELAQMEDCIVIVTTRSIRVSFDILKEVLSYGIERFDHLENWMSFVRGI